MGPFNFFQSNPKAAGPYSGGTGKSMEDAIKISATSSVSGIQAEYAYVEMQCGRRDFDWTLELQTLLEPEGPDGKHYDLLRVKLKDGTLRDFYFDISSFFGAY